jgi:Kef-type K+ transport system membrane component KefB
MPDFAQIAALLVVAGVFGIFAKLFKQPLLIGYLFAGLFLAFTGVVTESQSLQSLGQVGVTLLLFLLGLEMNVSDIPEIGKTALVTGLGQIFFTSGLGFIIAYLIGFGLLPSVYIAVALTFSSTIIMVKLLSEKKDLSSLYGRIAVGFLLIQDFVAILILMFLSSLGKGEQTYAQYLFTGAKAVVLITFTVFLSKKIIPYIFDKLIATSQELLFIVSIAWALGFASFVAGPLGFTLEIGGFLAGLALSNLGEHHQVASKTRSLRDFFLTIFFLLLGMQMVVDVGFSEIIAPAVLFSLFVLVGNPLIVLVIMGILGYKKRTSFLAGLTVAQISEFSLILMSMGLSLGHVGENEVAMVVLVGVVTMTISTYMITGSEELYKKLQNYLSIFEREKPRERALVKKLEKSGHIVLIGADRTGSIIKKYLRNKEKQFVVIDYNPKIFNRLTADNIPVIFGDVADKEILEASGIDKADMIISTIPSLEDNLTVLEEVKEIRDMTTIFTAQMKSEAIRLYENGASYVTVPDVIAGEHIRHVLSHHGKKKGRIEKLGKANFERLLTKN